ncbi:MAG TPA: MFS transporter [Selenomonadales bacterium]|nr:MFS transporter [Selenomonadales bacterium]
MTQLAAGRLSALSFFLLLIIGITFSLAGVVTKEVAATFAVDTYVIGYIFSLFTIGYSLAILGNGFVLDRIDIKVEMLAALALTGAAIVGATCFTSIAVFAVSIFLYGLTLGVQLSVAYYLIVNLHDEKARAAKVSLLNFFFSLGAIVAPTAAGLILQAGVKWQWIYQGLLFPLLAAAIGVCRLRFQVRPRAAGRESGGERWGSGIYLASLALLCYVLSEMIFGYWVVVYMMDRLALEVAVASATLSVFWVFMATGRLLSGLFIARISLWRFIVICSILACAAFALLLNATEAKWAIGLVALMGLGYSGLYAAILSYGTLQGSRPSSRLTTFFLTVGSVGGIAAFLLSSYMKQHFDVATAMGLGAFLMGMVTVFTIAARAGNPQ